MGLGLGCNDINHQSDYSPLREERERERKKMMEKDSGKFGRHKLA